VYVPGPTTCRPKQKLCSIYVFSDERSVHPWFLMEDQLVGGMW
jgi:hypothetical protein